MAEGSTPGTIFDCDPGTRNFVAFVNTPTVALQLLRKGKMQGTALVVDGNALKEICGITEFPIVAVISRQTGEAAFHLQGRLGLETKACRNFQDIQAMTEKQFRGALALANGVGTGSGHVER